MNEISMSDISEGIEQRKDFFNDFFVISHSLFLKENKMSTVIWNYSYNLPGSFKMSVIVKAQQADDDFNLYIYDPNGHEIAQDDSPDANAYCVFTTTSSGSYKLKLERVKGSGGFSLKIAAGYLPPPTPHNQNPHPLGASPQFIDDGPHCLNRHNHDLPPLNQHPINPPRLLVNPLPRLKED
ncbi:hypothetical protein BGP_4149 [Beggiatoa sp. PS]|nr:hypothetical protein BGP_4149 [Beggiatoa sp. PS]